MEQRRKVDRTLQERHLILRLLEKLKSDGITVGELEEIGAKLRPSGKRALSPLVRKLWRERSGDLISKYTFLLDFFDDDSWVDQLIQIALKRKDLEDDAKAALVAALEEYGVDVSYPPLAASLRPESGGLPRLLDRGEQGLVTFMEDFFFRAPEGRLALIRDLPRLAGQHALPFLEVMIGIDDQEILVETLTALGRLRLRDSAALMHQCLHHDDQLVREAAARNLRRLSFIGIDTSAPSFLSPFPPLS